MRPRVNKWLDLLDRVAWTAIQAAAGATFAALVTEGMSWEAAVVAVGTATLLAVCKVLVAQRMGTNELGAAVPGNVLEESDARATQRQR
jgi:hypothetical protein